MMKTVFGCRPLRRVGRMAVSGGLAWLAALGLVLALQQMACAAPTIEAQLASAWPLAAGPIQAQKFPTLMLDVWSDAMTLPVPTEPQNFLIKLDGRADNVAFSETSPITDLPVDIVVILDTVITSDTQHAQTQKIITSAVSALLQVITDSSHIALIRATAGAAEKLSGLNDTRQQQQTILATLTSAPGPSTRMTDAVRLAINAFEPERPLTPKRRRAIVIVSDQGGNWLDRASVTPAERAALLGYTQTTSHPPVFAVLYAPSKSDSLPLIQALPAANVITTPLPNLQGALKSLIDNLRTGMRITLVANTQRVKAGEQHSLSVMQADHLLTSQALTPTRQPIPITLALQPNAILTTSAIVNIAASPELSQLFMQTATVAYQLSAQPFSISVNTSIPPGGIPYMYPGMSILRGERPPIYTVTKIITDVMRLETQTAPFTDRIPFTDALPFSMSWPLANLIGETTRTYTLTTIITDVIGNVGRHELTFTVPATFAIHILNVPGPTDPLPYSTSSITFSLESNYPLVSDTARINGHTLTNTRANQLYNIETAPNQLGDQSLIVTGQDSFGRKAMATANIRIAGFPWLSDVGPFIVLLIAYGLLLWLAAWLWQRFAHGYARLGLHNSGNVACRYEVKAEITDAASPFVLALQHHGVTLQTVPEIRDNAEQKPDVVGHWWRTPEFRPGQNEALVLQVTPEDPYVNKSCAVVLTSRMCTEDVVYLSGDARQGAPEQTAPVTVSMPHRVYLRALLFLAGTASAIGVVSWFLINVSKLWGK